MRDRRYTILSTGNLPFDRIGPIPDSIEIRVLPLTEIVARHDDILITGIQSLVQKKITAVFTSANAVKFVSDICRTKPDWLIYCIHNETRSAVTNWLGENTLIKSAENASVLSDYLIKDKVKEVDFFCGDQRMNILPDRLKGHHINLKEWIVYETRSVSVDIDYHPDAILFFSPTAVKSFFSGNHLSRETRVFAIGKTTAAALRPFTAGPVTISPEPDKALIVRMAIDYAVSHPIY